MRLDTGHTDWGAAQQSRSDQGTHKVARIVGRRGASYISGFVHYCWRSERRELSRNRFSRLSLLLPDMRRPSRRRLTSRRTRATDTGTGHWQQWQHWGKKLWSAQPRTSSTTTKDYPMSLQAPSDRDTGVMPTVNRGMKERSEGGQQSRGQHTVDFVGAAAGPILCYYSTSASDSRISTYAAAPGEKRYQVRSREAS